MESMESELKHGEREEREREKQSKSEQERNTLQAD
jgi:hypothetical protein